VNRMLSQPLWRPPRLAMAKDGRFTDTRPTADNPSETLVMNGLHLSWPPIQSMCANLAAGFGHPVQANAYLTPSNSSGYPHHSDPHSAVVQTEGCKVWHLFEPVESLGGLAGREPDLALRCICRADEPKRASSRAWTREIGATGQLDAPWDVPLYLAWAHRVLNEKGKAYCQLEKYLA